MARESGRNDAAIIARGGARRIAWMKKIAGQADGSSIGGRTERR
jgi:hypothetical protein